MFLGSGKMLQRYRWGAAGGCEGVGLCGDLNPVFSQPVPAGTPREAGAGPERTQMEGRSSVLFPAPLLPAPQVIRKIRVEQFPDASGSLKLWCQFFNILSDSVLTWAKDLHPVGEVGRR